MPLVASVSDTTPRIICSTAFEGTSISSIVLPSYYVDSFTPGTSYASATAITPYSAIGTGNTSYVRVVSPGGIIQFFATTQSGSSTNLIVPVAIKYVPPKINHRKIRFERDQARKALWRSVRLFENLFGLNQIQIFMNGGAFEIEGRKFNYRISKNYTGLIEHTKNPNRSHIPYKLEVLSKQGLVLFQGCTVFKNTPIIDQITALILHIRDNEEHVLLNMNFSRLTDNFYKDIESLEYINSLKNTNYKLLGAT